LLPLGEFEQVDLSALPEKARSTENCWLLYSVGPDLRDDWAQKNDRTEMIVAGMAGRGDIIFPLAEVRD
jgi:hypothetical protein